MKRIKYSLIHFYYLIRHKCFVFIECSKRGLFWQGIVHDLSKLTPAEFMPYVRHFYFPEQKSKIKRDITGYYKASNSGSIEFDKAWHHHVRHNLHHWQSWIMIDEINSYPLEVPQNYAIEMVCDWIGANKSQHTKKSVAQWYNKHKDEMIFHSNTRKIIEEELKRIFGPLKDVLP